MRIKQVKILVNSSVQSEKCQSKGCHCHFYCVTSWLDIFYIHPWEEHRERERRKNIIYHFIVRIERKTLEILLLVSLLQETHIYWVHTHTLKWIVCTNCTVTDIYTLIHSWCKKREKNSIQSSRLSKMRRTREHFDINNNRHIHSEKFSLRRKCNILSKMMTIHD